MTSPTDILNVPSPVRREKLTAEAALEHIRAAGGRVMRMRERPVVICLTSSEALVDWLLPRGASLHTPRVLSNGKLPPGAYLRARDSKTPEWDLWITGLEVEGDLWEAAAR